MSGSEKKFGVAEVIIVSLFIFIMGLLDVIPFVGPMLNFAFTQLYLYMKGVSGTYQFMMLGSNVLTETISGVPGLGFIGDLTDLVAYWLAVLDDWFAPEEAKKALDEAGNLTQSIEGRDMPSGKGAAGAGATAEAGKAEGVAAEAGTPQPQEVRVSEEGVGTEVENREGMGEGTKPGEQDGEGESGGKSEGERDKDILETPEEGEPMENVGKALDMPEENFSEREGRNKYEDEEGGEDEEGERYAKAA